MDQQQSVTGPGQAENRPKPPIWTDYPVRVAFIVGCSISRLDGKGDGTWIRRWKRIDYYYDIIGITVLDHMTVHHI